jgi:predicted CoA-binding protein
MKTLVIGASENKQRYSNIAMNMLKDYQHEVVAVGNRSGEVSGIPFSKEKRDFQDVDTVTLYLGPQNQADYIDYVDSLNPRRVIFNPGTENQDWMNHLQKRGIETEVACTLVLLRTDQY